MRRLVLVGDDVNQPQELSDAEVNHLRRLLAWLTCEYNLSDAGQQGLIAGLTQAVEAGATVERAQEVLEDEVKRIARVPAYIRQAIKMLDKAVRNHDRKSRIIDEDVQ